METIIAMREFITSLCTVVGAVTLSTLPVLFVLWWGDKISH